MRQKTPAPRTFLASAALVLVFALGALAQPPDVNVSAGLTATGAPLALRGYDAVSYFTGGKPQLGVAAFSAVHGGATYQFASKANLAEFEKGPERYVPQYGGFCAYGVALGAKFDGDPLVWKIVDRKLYLNLNPEIAKIWNKDVKGSLVKADANWPGIRSAAPETLKPRG